ncbi:MAG: membrane integrity-associated transporter subunit PqiC [Comamonadaceae bacterium]|nr:MAG: membrane integrity-associated transporter subunit PqiC [Comamonadaceae bacterium]
MNKPLALMALVASMALAGCASPPTLYYTLAGAADAPPAATPPAAAAAPLYLEFAPVALPERLARAQMVVRLQGDKSAQVEVLEQHRWASSFENELRDALASSVASRLGAFDATKGGRQNSMPVWRIAVQVRQFDATEGARVDAAFGWTIKRSDATLATTCQFALSEPVGAGIDAVADGARRVVASAAAAIARSVTAAQTNPAGPCAL